MDGVRDYIEHAEGLLKDFQDVLGDADKPGEGLCATHVMLVSRVRLCAQFDRERDLGQLFISRTHSCIAHSHCLSDH